MDREEAFSAVQLGMDNNNMQSRRRMIIVVRRRRHRRGHVTSFMGLGRRIV